MLGRRIRGYGYGHLRDNGDRGNVYGRYGDPRRIGVGVDVENLAYRVA